MAKEVQGTVFKTTPGTTASGRSHKDVTERLRFMTFGEIPRYYNSLLRIASDQHPMVSAVKDAERLLMHANPAGGARADARTRAEAYR